MPNRPHLSRPEAAAAIRDGLRNLYSVIKDSDAHIRFAFLTGVSKFSKVSLFSGLNNLNDITVDSDGRSIHLVGVEFSRERRGLVGFEVEHLG